MTVSEEGAKIVRSTTWSAGPGCHGGCGVLLYVKDGKLIKIEGDPNHPWNQGRLCPRALALTQYLYHPDRITHPMKRVGKRGENKWERITWDEAFKIIQEKFWRIKERYGGKAIVFGQGTGRDIGGWMTMLAYSVGSPNWCNLGLSGHSCYTPRLAATYLTCGEFVVMDASQWFADRYDDPKYQIPECIVVWANNSPLVCPDGFHGPWVVDCMKRGSKAVVIDPRYNWLASRAEYALGVRPGTDGALALGMLNVIINENLYDKEFVEKWTNAPHLIRTDNHLSLKEKDLVKDGQDAGYYVWDQKSKSVKRYKPDTVEYEDPNVKPALEGTFNVKLANGSTVPCKTVWQLLKERVSEFPPERVEEITWVPKDKLIKASRLYAKSKPATIQWGLGIDMAGESTAAGHAIALLWYLTGNLDVPGGNAIARYAFGTSPYPIQASASKAYDKTLPPDVREMRLGTERYPLVKHFRQWAQPDVVYDAMRTGKPYPVKALWIQTNNVIACMGLDPKGHYDAIKKMDFVVVVDLFMTPTAVAFGDLFLPAVTFAEKNSFRTWWAPLSATCKAIEPVGESRSDMDINLELAKKFNEEAFPYKDSTEMLSEFLKPVGLTFGELCQKHWLMPPENHPSGCTPYKRYEKGLLRADGKPGFNTLSGKVEIYSYRQEAWGREDPLPYYKEPRPDSPVDTPETFKEYPLILGTGRRSTAFFHSEHRQIPWCREIDPHPIVEINPTTAAKLEIKNGDWVWIENRYGKIRRVAKLTPEVNEKMVMVPHGWWLPELPAEEPSLFGVFDINVNMLIPMGYQGTSGFGGSPYKSMSCKIYKAEKGVY